MSNYGKLELNSNLPDDFVSFARFLNQYAYETECVGVEAVANVDEKGADDGSYTVTFTYMGAEMPYSGEMRDAPICDLDKSSQPPVKVTVKMRS